MKLNDMSQQANLRERVQAQVIRYALEVVAEEMANTIPGARLVRFAGSGHLPSMEVPEAVNAAMAAWLAD